MIKISTLFFLSLSMIACTAPMQMPEADKVSGQPTKVHAQKNEVTAITPRGVDSTYPFSETYSQYMITGYYNEDTIEDAAFLLRHIRTHTKAALYIKHGGSNESVLFKDGKALGQDFENFHWVGQFEKIEKGSIIWDNVVNGEVVSEQQVPVAKKIRLKTDAIFMHEDEGGGGGIVYYAKGKYVWVQQD